MSLWFQADIGVPPCDPNYDVGLGGSHDMTFLADANTVVTSVVSGTVSDISAPSWGKQVGILLDHPVGDIKWFHYLHLSATNPLLAVGKYVSIGDTIGWVGGGHTQADYAGTSNPTGKNFCNSTDMSSQVQVGIALMRGPAYGGTGWQNFPPIDTSLNPYPLVQSYITKAKQFDTYWSQGYGAVGDDVWYARDSGICSIVKWGFLLGRYGLQKPNTDEFLNIDWNGRDTLMQSMDVGHVEYRNAQATVFDIYGKALYTGRL
jgi:hypothetical protein